MPPSLDNLAPFVNAVSSALGPRLERVFLYGSYSRGDWNPETSDVDFAVLLSDDDVSSANEVLFSLRDEFLPEKVAWRAEFFVAPLKRVAELRSLPSCIEAKILSEGVALFDSGSALPDALSYDDARRVVAGRGLRAAERCCDSALSFLRSANAYLVGPSIASDKARTASCLALRALCATFGVDPSPKSTRWKPKALVDACRPFLSENEVSRLSKIAALIPERNGELVSDDSDVPLEQARRETCMALLVLRGVARNSSVARLLTSSFKPRGPAL